ncbi:MAG: ATP-binding cassette domain-containing protein [Actinomycetota bacterium]
MTEPTIEVDDLVKVFGEQRALDGLSLRAAPGEVLGVLGPNGAGKTTAINVLSTLLTPDGGTAKVCGHDVVADPDAVRRSISLTGQFAAVDELLTGHENLVLFGRLRSLPKKEAVARADELLERFSLTDAATKRVGEYSGGMRRRLDLAASMVVPAPVLFLDEPTTGLDPRSRNELWDVVRELRADGLTIVLTTQYLEEADRLADHIVVIDAGRVIASGTADELKASIGGGACVVTPLDARDSDALRDALGVLGTVEVDDEATGAVAVLDGGDLPLIEVVQAASEAGIGLADVARRRPTLDDVFLQLTGDEPSTSEADAADDAEVDA